MQESSVLCRLLPLTRFAGRQPAGPLKRPSQDELHLPVCATQLVLGPAPESVKDLRIRAKKERLPTTHTWSSGHGEGKHRHAVIGEAYPY